MIVIFPEILKDNKNFWHFSEEEPWKPVANEDAPDEVIKAIAEFVSALEAGPAELFEN